MSLMRLSLLGLVFLLAALIALMPLSFAHTLSGEALGQTATPYGRIWNGRIYGARLGEAAYERFDLGLRPLSLLTGRAVFDWTLSDARARGEGEAFVGFSSAGIRQSRFTSTLSGLGLTLPAFGGNEAVSFDIEHLSFDNSGCQEAFGEVRTPALMELASRYDVAAPMLSGPVSCNNGILEAGLSGANAEFSLMVRISLTPSGLWRWEAETEIHDQRLTPVFSSLGFVQDGGLWTARGEGQL